MTATTEQIASLRRQTPPSEIGTLAGRMNKKTNRKSPDMSYVTARYAMDTLDDGVGPENWATDKFRDESGQLYVGVGILTADGWVWKWDTGDESDIEPGKGEFSDAFKRASVHWGIARDLYPSPNKTTAKAKPATTAKSKPAAKRPAKKVINTDVNDPVDAEAEVVGQSGLTTKQQGKLFASLRDAGVPDDKRKELVHSITGKTSTKDMTNDDLDLVLTFTEGGQYSETAAE